MGRRTHRGLDELRNDDSRARGETALAKLMRGTSHTKESSIPPREPGDDPVPFVWRVLTGREKQECLARACARFDALGIPKELRTYTDLENEVTWQLVAAGMRDPAEPGDDRNPYPKPLGTPDEVRDALTVDERDILITEYMDLEEQVDPDPVLMPELWHRDIEAALKKSLRTEDRPEAERTLSNFGSRALLSYLLTTVAPQLISPTGKSESSLDDGVTTNDP